MELLAKARAKVRLVGTHPKDNAPVEIRKGRFGPYAQHGKTVANLPRNLVMEEATLEQVVTLLAEKGKELKPMVKGAKARRRPSRPKPRPMVPLWRPRRSLRRRSSQPPPRPRR